MTSVNCQNLAEFENRPLCVKCNCRRQTQSLQTPIRRTFYFNHVVEKTKRTSRFAVTTILICVKLLSQRVMPKEAFLQTLSRALITPDCVTFHGQLQRTVTVSMYPYKTVNVKKSTAIQSNCHGQHDTPFDCKAVAMI